MRRSLLAPLTVVTVLLLGLTTVWRPATTAANLQNPPESDSIQVQISLPEGALSVAPAFVLLRRINIEPGGTMPLHSHPGLGFYVIESGTLAYTVSGKAVLSRAATDEGTPTAGADAPLDEEFRMRRGDSLVTWAQTPKTYRNPGERPTKVLAGFFLPAGHQRPPTISYLNGSSSADIQGVTPEFLGDAVSPTLPTGPSILTVDKLGIEAGAPIPGFNGPMMLSVSSGPFDFTTVSGELQISRAADQSVTVNPVAGTAFSLGRGDALYVPNGMQETQRSANDGETQLIRMTIAAEADASATPVADAGPAVIEIAGVDDATPEAATEEAESTEEVAPTGEPTQEPAEEETPEPTATSEDTGTFSEGDIVAATDDGVNVRSAPSTSGDVVTSLSAGQQVVITGASEEAEDYTWWPVALVDDESVSGYVVEDFIEKVEE
jgi:mannose-6-phosphate isomerase-like protein (cupin superfamily)